jgi:hypothetical protein
MNKKFNDLRRHMYACAFLSAAGGTLRLVLPEFFRCVNSIQIVHQKEMLMPLTMRSIL